MEDSALVKGVVLDKTFSHSQMPKALKVNIVANEFNVFLDIKSTTNHKIVFTGCQNGHSNLSI